MALAVRKTSGAVKYYNGILNSLRRYSSPRPEAHVVNRDESIPTRRLAWQIHNYGAIEDVQYDETRIPPLRGPDELLVRVHAASINPLDVAMIGGYGVEILRTLRKINYSESNTYELPLVVGRDFCGEVVRAGNKAMNKLPVGMRVWGTVPPHWPGSHQQYIIVKQDWVEEAPALSVMSDEEASSLPYAGLTAFAAAAAAGVGAGRGGGQRVLVLGLGGVGSILVQMLRYYNAQVLVACSAESGALARRLGACAVVERGGGGADYSRQVAEHGPYSAVVDCGGVGGEGARLAGEHARYVTLTTPLLRSTDSRGLLAGGVEAAAHWLRQNYNAATANRPAGCVEPMGRVRWAFYRPSTEGMQLLRKMVDNKQCVPCVERVFSAEEAREAYGRMREGHLRGKLVLRFRPPLA